MPALFEAQADITPEHVAVLLNTSCPNAARIAEHYAAARRLSREQLFEFALPCEDSISRADFEEYLVRPLRRELIARNAAQRTRVIVSTFGIPLRLRAPEQTGDEQRFLARAAAARDSARNRLDSMSAELRHLAPDRTEPAEEDRPLATLSEKEIIDRTQQAAQAAGKRIDAINNLEEKRILLGKLASIMMQAGGLALVAPPAAAGANKQYAELEREFREGQALIRSVEQLAPLEHQPAVYRLIERLYGAAGVLAHSAKDAQRFRYEAADASVDSELTMLWWEREMYQVDGRLPNPVYHTAFSEAGPPQTLPVMLVSRLDAPSPEDALRMIDSAAFAEKHGLAGDAYVDTRGLKPADADDLAAFDAQLRDFGWMLRRLTPFSVTLDRSEPVLREAPDAALYVGWYQLRKYSGSFLFPAGAIGYHVASEEAVSIHNPAETGWCRGLLKDGITATLGAVAEPYLNAFPAPQEFFGLMFTGRFSLVEAYFMTTPFISWRMVLFGDPLYNPWRKTPLVEFSKLELKRGEKTLTAMPAPPGERTMQDPVATLEQIRRNRASLKLQLDAHLKTSGRL